MSFENYRQLTLSRRANGVLLITIDRPEKYNAADEQMHAELANIWKDVSADRTPASPSSPVRARPSAPGATSRWSSGWRAITTGCRTCSVR